MKTQNLKLFIFILSIVLISLNACQSNHKEEPKITDPEIHKIEIKDIIQVTKYTYLFVSDNGKDQWVAVPKMEVVKGDIYYYKNGMLMTNFESKDLSKTFDTIIFLDKIVKDPSLLQNSTSSAISEPSANAVNSTPAVQQQNSGGMPKPVIEKKEVKVSKIAGGLTIEQLFSKKQLYENKVIKIRGQVTKVNNGIMNKNWVHIQDGSSFGNYMDLTVTTSGEYHEGDQVTFEGIIKMNQDYGYGYTYEVIMEDGKSK